MNDIDSLSSPQEVVLEFATAYTKWEQEMDTVGDKFNNVALQQSHAEILLRYCTRKKRSYLDGIASYSKPPTYYKVIQENIASVREIDRSRVYVDTKFLDGRAYRFVVIKKKDGWRIDSVKRRFEGQGEWENTLIGS